MIAPLLTDLVGCLKEDKFPRLFTLFQLLKHFPKLKLVKNWCRQFYLELKSLRLHLMLTYSEKENLFLL